MLRARTLTCDALVGIALLGALACASRGGREPSKERAEDSSGVGGEGKSMQELFAGRFPGVQVFSSPDGGISLRIRGSSSVLGSGEPLYVVDGMPLASGTGGILFLSPNDIQKIEVLKSAGEIAEYGVQGANGVVRITTKRPR